MDLKQRPVQPMPMQSPTQKMPKLKSVIQRVNAHQHFSKPPYKSLRKDAKDFIRYLQGSLDRKAYDAKIWSMVVLHNSAAMARRVIASTKTALVVTTRGIRLMAPVIPMELMNSPNIPSKAEIPGPPTHSEDYQSVVQIHCVREWTYLLKLLQYWHDANSLYKYGGPVQTEFKLMPWHSYYFEHHSKEDHEAYFRDNANIIQGLEHLRNWVKNRYLAKAHETWHHLKTHSGDIDRLPYPQSYEDQHPGNKCVFYRKWGATMEDVEIRPENAPRIANMMIIALARHNRQQREARDRQEFLHQQNNTVLPGATFLPLRTMDWDAATELDPTLEGVEGATAAPEPSSSSMTSGQSESTVPILEKKKIILDQYHRCKPVKQQQTAASLNLDKNGECLDYDNFEKEDDPDNIQINYQMPAPSPQTSIPPLEDTPMSASLTTTQSQAITSPGTIPSNMEHFSTAVNQVPGFRKGLPVQRTMPIRVGTPQDSTLPMQVGTLQPRMSSSKGLHYRVHHGGKRAC